MSNELNMQPPNPVSAPRKKRGGRNYTYSARKATCSNVRAWGPWNVERGQPSTSPRWRPIHLKRLASACGYYQDSKKKNGGWIRLILEEASFFFSFYIFCDVKLPFLHLSCHWNRHTNPRNCPERDRVDLSHKAIRFRLDLIDSFNQPRYGVASATPSLTIHHARRHAV